MVWQCSACHVAVSFLFLLLWGLASSFLSLLDLQRAHTLEFFMFAGEKDGGGGVFSEGCMLQTFKHTQKKTFSDFFGVFLCLTKRCQKSVPDRRCQTSPATKMSLLKYETHLGIKVTLQDELDRGLFTVSCQATTACTDATDYASSPRKFCFIYLFYLFIFFLQLMQVIKISMNKCSVNRDQSILFFLNMIPDTNFFKI